MNDSICPGGPRHKPFGVSRGSPRSQLCIYCTQLINVNVVIKIVLFYSIFYSNISGTFVSNICLLETGFEWGTMRICTRAYIF